MVTMGLHHWGVKLKHLYMNTPFNCRKQCYIIVCHRTYGTEVMTTVHKRDKAHRINSNMTTKMLGLVDRASDNLTK